MQVVNSARPPLDQGSSSGQPWERSLCGTSPPESVSIEQQPCADPMQIRLENICKRYGRREVVSDVSLHIQQGEVVGLLGPNGAGKTTTFYIMTGPDPAQPRPCLAG